MLEKALKRARLDLRLATMGFNGILENPNVYHVTDTRPIIALRDSCLAVRLDIAKVLRDGQHKAK